MVYTNDSHHLSSCARARFKSRYRADEPTRQVAHSRLSLLLLYLNETMSWWLRSTVQYNTVVVHSRTQRLNTWMIELKDTTSIHARMQRTNKETRESVCVRVIASKDMCYMSTRHTRLPTILTGMILASNLHRSPTPQQAILTTSLRRAARQR